MADLHIPAMIERAAQRDPSAPAFRRKQDGAWVDVPWKDVQPRIAAIAAGLLTAADLPDGARVSIIGNTTMDWVILDFAAMSVGLQTVPVYASLLPEEVGFMHADPQVRLVVAENAAQVAKVRAMRGGFRFFEKEYGADQVPLLGRIVVVDPTGLEPADDWESLADLEARGVARLPELREEMARRLAKVQRSDIATFTYTSGTTGPPKAVIQTHDNMLSLVENIEEVDIFGPAVREGGLFLFLPLAHSFGRLIELAGPYFATPLVLSSVPTLAADLLGSRPGFLPAAPRVYEKMKGKVDGGVAASPPVRQKIFAWAIGVGKETIPYVTTGQPLPAWLAFRRAIADKLVFSKVRAKMGLDRCAVLLSGSAPLRADVHEFFLALGFNLIEAYGLTETCPGLTANRPGRMKIGTVGQPIKGVTIKVADDGEVLAKGPNITSGYLNRPDATGEAFDADGWFHTGDLGSVDSENFLTITGRKKELFKTSFGKYIAPVKIEARLKAVSFVQEAVLIGDGHHYCVALFSLDPENFGEWAQREGIPAEPGHARVRQVIEAHVAAVNGTLASFETVKYFEVVPGPFSVDGGELTASLKVKRKVVSTKYAHLIDDMYARKAPGAE
ncbi:MAG: long-chain fatty acid--CoA ligase [Deltaproteobacteria bacterium]|nr:long-chain fatty acid--CoA ligase [Deltaproteobacteria bacterium]